jgi:protein associated with RNAse G/E
MEELNEYNPNGKRKAIPEEISDIIRKNIRIIVNSTVYRFSAKKNRFYAKDVASMVNKLKAIVYRHANNKSLNVNPILIQDACEYAIRDLISASGE